MFQEAYLSTAVVLAVLSVVVVVVVAYTMLVRANTALKHKEAEARRRMYELAILKEISDRTGYSLNIKKILDVISGSLSQLLDFSAVGYILLEPTKVVFKADLDASVSPNFIKEMRKRMLDSIGALTGSTLEDLPLEETLTGAVTLEDIDEPVRSFFNIPVVIGGRVVGVLTVAHTVEGLYKEDEVGILYKIIGSASQAVARLEEVIKTEQGKAAAMLESMVEGVVMTDTEYHILAANPVLKTLIGKSGAPSVTLLDLAQVFEGAFDVRVRLEEAIKLNKTVTLDDVVFSGKHFQILISPVRARGGMLADQILGGAIIFHDITHEKEAEQMRNDFTSMMVHELRAPLGNIKKIGELLKSKEVLRDTDSSAEYAQMLYESSGTMLDLVNDLLDVAKLESGKFAIVKESLDFKEIIEDRGKFFEPLARELGITLKTNIQPGTVLGITGDSARLKQVLNNLLSNAFNYTPRGGVVTIGCFSHRKGVSFLKEAEASGLSWITQDLSGEYPDLGDALVVSVTDTGEGILPEHIKKLWNKFTQFAPSVRARGDHKGTGLGLVIVKGIVEAHGGVVGLGSRKGQGTTVYFAVPR